LEEIKMKISKIFAGMSAMAIAASMLTMVSASAAGFTVNTAKDGEVVDNISMTSWSSQWVKCYDEGLKDADLSKYVMRFKVSTDGTYTAEDNVAFKVYGVNGDNDQGAVFAGVEGQKDYVFDYNLGDVVVDEWGGFGFNTQAGHRDVTFVSCEIVEAAAEPDTPVTGEIELTPDNCNFNADSNVFYLLGDESKGEGGYFATNADLVAADIKSITYYVNISDEDVANGTWIGGGIGTNGETNSWNSHEFTTQDFVTDEFGGYVDEDGDGLADRVKECQFQKVSDNLYAYTLVNEEGFFSEKDTYAQVWMQDWSVKTMTLAKVVLNAEKTYDNKEQPKVVALSSKKIEIGKGVSYNAPYELKASSIDGVTGAQKAVVDVSGIMANEGSDVAWNDWCCLYISVTDAEGAVKYYPVIGAEVGWDITVDDNGTPDNKDDDVIIPVADCTKADAEGKASVTVPFTDGSTIKVVALGWNEGEQADIPYINVDAVTVFATDIKDPTPDDPSSEPSSESVADSTSESTTDSTTSSKASSSSKAASNNTTTNPNTGAAALAAVGVALAGAAVVASKKRK